MELQKKPQVSAISSARFASDSLSARMARGLTSPWNRHNIIILADFQDFDNCPSSRRASTTSSFNCIDFGKSLPEPPYHVFSITRKRQVVYLVSVAAVFSPLSLNIYFPALGQISTSLNTSAALLSTTIAIYMVIQGIAPNFWALCSDIYGRRLMFIGTLVVYLIANIGLGLSQNLAALLVFRGLQAAGSAATISIGAGVIGDITTPKERGGLIGAFGGIRMMGQALGPVLGGIITEFFGFRAIFWFLIILGGLSLASIVIFLPETLRSIAGNGTTRLTGIHKSLIYTLRSQPDVLNEPEEKEDQNIRLSSIFSPMKFIVEKDIFVTLLLGGVVYTIWSMVTSSTTTLFQATFQFSPILTGLAFLPNGLGCVTGSLLAGQLLERSYQTTETEYRITHELSLIAPLPADTPDFPLEHARLRNSWWLLVILTVSTALYGFSFLLEHPAPPLVLQFFIAFTATAICSVNSALLIDLWPGKAAGATAVNNFMRCSLGALGVAVIDLLIEHFGLGVTFVSLAILTLTLFPLLVLEMALGKGWRAARVERIMLRKVERGSS